MPDLRHPGVYAIALSDADLSGQPFSWLSCIVYVGMTNSISGLRGRLRQFDDTIAGRHCVHGGADRVRYKYRNYEILVSEMFVAVSPRPCRPDSYSPADLRTMGDVAKLEFDCLARIVEMFGCLPEFNNKGASPKYSLTAGRAKD